MIEILQTYAPLTGALACTYGVVGVRWNDPASPFCMFVVAMLNALAFWENIR